ncbi:MAG TPA: hypothetical protein VFM88_08600, partial [Vicinamibacteria bacterium]|nr:hypothetical protein [Vicinamibacteria bacterium]
MRIRASNAAGLAFVALATASALGHESHTPSPPPTSAAQPAVEPPPATEESRPAPAPLEIDARDALSHHLHNKIVHFPIALGIAGAVLLLLSYRWPQFGPGARALLVLAALTAWVAVRSG